MGLDAPKHVKAVLFFMLNNYSLNNFDQESSPRDVLALSLLLAVYDPGLGPDGPGFLKKTQNHPSYIC